ncbi:MAG: PPOX class F420-dependent oxidoreductase [Acidimicrobiales bacterium]
MTFTGAELDYLRSQRLGRLATAQPNGTLQASPVGFTVNEELGTIDIGGFNMDSSQKYRNVAANGQAAFVVDDVVSVDPWVVRGLEVRGTAEALPAGNGHRGAIIRIHPRRIIGWGLGADGRQGSRRTVGAGAAS